MIFLAGFVMNYCVYVVVWRFYWSIVILHWFAPHGCISLSWLCSKTTHSLAWFNLVQHNTQCDIVVCKIMIDMALQTLKQCCWLMMPYKFWSHVDMYLMVCNSCWCPLVVFDQMVCIHCKDPSHLAWAWNRYVIGWPDAVQLWLLHRRFWHIVADPWCISGLIFTILEMIIFQVAPCSWWWW